MKKTRLYTSCVLEKVVFQDGKAGWVKVSDADSGTEALKKVKEFAEKNPDRAFCACNMWPAVMTKAVTTFVYVDPEDPTKLLKDIPVDDEEGEEDDVSPAAAAAPAAVSAPTVVVPEPAKAEPAKPVAPPAAPPAAKPVATPAAKPAVAKPADKPADKPAPKAEVKQEGFTDLFAGTSAEEPADKQEETFANEDEIDPDETGDGGVPKGLF